MSSNQNAQMHCCFNNLVASNFYESEILNMVRMHNMVDQYANVRNAMCTMIFAKLR